MFLSKDSSDECVKNTEISGHAEIIIVQNCNGEEGETEKRVEKVEFLSCDEKNGPGEC